MSPRIRRRGTGASALALGVLAFTLSIAACGDDPTDPSNRPGGPLGQAEPNEPLDDPTRMIEIDGPRVVRPFVTPAAINFEQETRTRIEVSASGGETAADKLCAGEISIAGAAEPLEPRELDVCRENGIEPVRVKVANEAVAVVANPGLRIDCLTVEQLDRLWRPGSDVNRYSDLDRSYPSTAPLLYGPPPEHDTFDFFTEAVVGKEGAIRDDYEVVEDTPVLADRLTEIERSLAFFNYGHVDHDIPAKLKPIAVDAGEGCVEPTTETIQSGAYEPLERPLYLYVSDKALERPQVRRFMQYIFESYEQTAQLAETVVPLTDEERVRAEDKLPEAPAPAG